jgi:hypothetical protein
MNKWIFWIFIWFPFISFCQLGDEVDSLINARVIPYTSGLVAYYFIETDSNQALDLQTLQKPFVQNYNILLREEKQLNIESLKTIIMSYAHDNSKGNSKSTFEIEEKNQKIKIECPLQKKLATKTSSVLFIKNNQTWSSIQLESVLYFNISEDETCTFSHSSDSIQLEKEGLSIRSNGHYIVYSYQNKFEKIKKQLVYTHAGENVTDYLKNKTTLAPQRYLVFANGYRGPSKNRDESDHLVTTKDRYHYWFKIDDRFIDRLSPAESFYIDGSMSIATSNHKNMVRFALSMFRSSKFLRKHRAKKQYKALNTEPNIPGFEARKSSGKFAALTFLNARCNSPACLGIKDTIDIVCHSMGYAYTLGFIEELKGKVIFGKIYIIAAESACVDGADWSLFEEVWQYGSNLGEPDADPVWEQDGIAPQCAVKGIDSLPPNTQGGRLFFPKDWKRKNFIDSHQLYNYYWIFTAYKPNEKAFID